MGDYHRNVVMGYLFRCKSPTLQAKHNLMQRDMDAMRRLSGLEIRGLKTISKQVEDERDDLQLQVWELEQQVEELLTYIAQAHPETDPKAKLALTSSTEGIQPEEDSPETDLSRVYLGLVGGHPTTRRSVQNRTNFGTQIA
jgi:hypothetical protein